jgi:hypothetical protein
MKQTLALVFTLSLLGTIPPMNAQEGEKHSFEATSTERVPFKPGGKVRVENSYGYLSVEGWDEPEVEVTVTKSTDHYYQPAGQAQAEKRLSGVHIALESPSPGEAAIRTNAAPGRLLVLRWPSRIRAGVTPDYRVLIPRDSQLFVQHDFGYVWVNDVKGDLEVHSHTGDMIVALSEAGSYSIDARTKLGSVWSDFAEGKRVGRFLLGSGFVHTDSTPAPRVQLRMGRGNITIIKGPASGPYWKN